jgi:hypothetical protein
MAAAPTHPDQARDRSPRGRQERALQALAAEYLRELASRDGRGQTAGDRRASARPRRARLAQPLPMGERGR